MTVSVFFVLLGLALLAGGGELLVRGATSLARLSGLGPTVIGLTVVAAGTSMPELVVSVRSALAGNADLALGNVVGSNIFNITAILGISALVAPLRIAGNTVRFEWPIMLLAAFQLHLLVRDGWLDRLEGVFLLTGMIAFVVYIVVVARRATGPEERKEFQESLRSPLGDRGSPGWLVSVGVTVAGIALLVAGSEALVRGAVEVASGFGVTERVIGLTVVAAGTSTPELAASVMASLRGRDDVAVANVVGSNIFNTLGIAGCTAAIQPLTANPILVAQDNLWMLGFSVLLFPLMRSGLQVSRKEGAFLLAAFGLYITTLLWG